MQIRFRRVVFTYLIVLIFSVCAGVLRADVTGSILGTVRDVFFPGESQPGTPLLAVNTSSGELLIPLAEDICTRIDTVARRIEVRLPAGLRDSNEAE